jgi:hypothetical protein
MPEEGRLPESLKALAYKQARKLDDDHWDEDVTRLAAQLEKVCGASPRPSAPDAKPRLSFLDMTPDRSGVLKVAVVAGVAALVAAAVVGIFLSARKGSPQPQINAGLEQAQAAAVVTPAVTPKPLERRAVVNLAQNEAEFFLPFDTTGEKWTWYRRTSKVDEDEYHWNVFVPGDYKITLFLKKIKGDTPGKGDFKSLMAYTEKGVRSAKPGEDFGGVDKKFPLEITPTPEPGGLRIVVKGAGVERMFAKERPKEVGFMVVRPDEEGESEWTIPVEYK